ncbi:hypothetical protein VTO42DRAFT_936 [Malbranchea cinnamomea]
MAGETREPEIPAETQTGDSAESFQTPKKPKHQFPKSQVGKLWEEFGNPEEPINLMRIPKLFRKSFWDSTECPARVMPCYSALEWDLVLEVSEQFWEG